MLAVAVSGLIVSPAARSRGSCEVENPDRPLDQIEQSMLDELNAYGRSKGLEPVRTSPSLRKAALWKSASRAAGAPDLVHDDPDRRWHERLNACGYDFIGAKGENLASFDGNIPPDQEAIQLLDSWKASPSHEVVQTNPRYKVVGIGRVRVPGTSKTFWTVDFGSAPDDTGVRASRLRDVRVPTPEEEPCIPAGGESECDSERLTLWSGDPGTWAPRLEEDGQPYSEEAVILYTLQFRAQAGSEQSRAILHEIGALP